MAATETGSPRRHWFGLLWPLAIVLALLLLVLAGLGTGARWLLATDDGTAWLLSRLPMVQARGFQGAVLGGRWRADSLRVQWDGGRQWLLLEGVTADDLRWAWRPSPNAWVGLDADRLQVRRVTLHTGPKSTTPPAPPKDLALPLQLALSSVRIDEVVVDDEPLLNTITARALALDPRPGGRHRVEQLSLRGFGLQIDGSAAVGSAAPLPVEARASVRPLADGDSPRWAAVLDAAGSLNELRLSGTLRGVPTPQHAAPAVDLRATVAPLAPWPLTALTLRTEALDLAAISPQAPSTRLAGEAALGGGGAGKPLKASVTLVNALPGRWNEGRAPLQKLTLEMSGSGDRYDLGRLEAVLADAKGGAGSVRGTATWKGHELDADLTLSDIAPQRLDGRAAAMTLGGPVQFSVRGLPSPDFRAAAAAPPPWSATWKLALQGQLDAAPQPVRVQLEGNADDAQIAFTRASATAGAASADTKMQFRRLDRGAGWQLATDGKLADFDPVPWWPGNPGTTWRKGPHRLSADWQLELRLPSDLDRLPPLALAQRLAGSGELHLRDSVLAGVPLAGDLKLATASPRLATLQAQLTAGGNSLAIDGRIDPGAGDNGTGDRWHAEFKGDALAALAPLLTADATLAPWAPRQGTAALTLDAEGRWPQMRVQGSARAVQLQAGALALARADASWRLDTGSAQTVDAKFELAGLVYDRQRAEQLRGEITGTWAQHRIEVSGALPIAPPPLAEQLLGVRAQQGTRALLRAQGGWTPDAKDVGGRAAPTAAGGGATASAGAGGGGTAGAAAGGGGTAWAAAGGGRWRARIEQLLVAAWDGSANAAPPASIWAEARDLQAELQFSGDAKLLAIRADPGRLRLAQAAVLRWDAVRIDLRGAEPQIQLKADIEPFDVVPLLARAQPAMGWTGDLKLRARLDISAAERMNADVVFERAGGDLHLASGDGTQLLGLTEFRLAASAHDGTWLFNPVFRGRTLGDVTGQLRVQTAPERRWPESSAPASGSLQAHVADIGIWSTFIPAGWRLTGELTTSATVGGTFGAPQYTGQLSGSKLGVRNLLQGVNVSDGQVSVVLAGDNARIERFTLKGGDGQITATGGASFGAKPQARVQFQAERFRVLNRIDRMVVASGNAELLLDADAGRLNGKVTIDEALFDAGSSGAPSLDDDVTVRLAGDKAGADAQGDPNKPRRNFVLALDLDLGTKLHVKGRGLDTMLGGLLRITNPGGRLAVNGTIGSQGGTYVAYGQNLVIERGLIAFSGPLDNPRLDVLALRPNIDQRVGVNITGNLLTMRVRLYSEPEMSDSDKLSWLMLGRASDGLGRNDAALLQRAAMALLAGEGPGPTDKLLKNLGIDEIGLRQSDSDVRETVITVGKQLSRRWYVGYERGVNSTLGNWQLIYRIAQRLTVRMQSGQDNALDVIWTWRFQEAPADAAMRKSTLKPPP